MLKNFLSENFRLKSEQIFEGLTTEELDMLMRSGVTHRYKKGEVVFREHAIPAGIFFIKSGMVKKYKVTPKGIEQIFYICGRGELIGYHSLLGEDRYPDSAATILDSEITFIPKESFLKVLRNSNILSHQLLKALGHEFSLFINTITTLATKSVRERLAFNLLILDERFRANGGGNHGEITLSRTDLANMIGTAKENLVRLLHEFVATGLIEKTSKSIKIVNRKGIIKEANLNG